MIGEFPKHSSILPSENYKMGVGESMSGPGSGPSAKDNAKQSAKQSLQNWLQLMASPGSGALQQLARDTEEGEEVEGDQCGDIQVRLLGPSPC